jgi:signal transduction histidine kinase
MSKLPVINENCVLRRNVRVQPYGRCTSCQLKLSGCHAWQSSLLAFGMIIFALLATVVADGWAVRAIAAGIILLVIWQGLANHRRTDELISSQSRLREQGENLAHEVDAATRELKETNRALAGSNLELIEIDRFRNSLVTNLTHDLRTPLAAIKGAADNLLDDIAGALGTDQREYVEIVREHAVRLTGTVNDLLLAAKIESGSLELNLESVEIRAIAEETVRSLDPLAKQRGVRVRVEGEAGVLRADRDKLRRALENLVSNAVKFSDEGQEVSVEVARRTDGVTIAVKDRGPGIPEPELARLFERFYRGSASRPGTGLGLSIVKNLVRLHGGEVEVKSRQGEGSEFRVHLPTAA